MVSDEIKQEIFEVWNTGKLSQTSIAHVFGVARSTVTEIIKRKLDKRCRKRPGRKKKAENEDSPYQALEEPVRCNGCGAKVITDPCVRCSLAS